MAARSFIDTNVWVYAEASAHAAGCNVIWTEDMNAGEVVNGVCITNPFA